MDMSHEFGRSVVIRLRYRVSGDGGQVSRMWVDADLSDRDTLLGVLLRAQSLVMGDGDAQHNAIDLSSLDEQLGAVEIDAVDDD